MAALKKIPVTVATGFLGAGKTTLINHILTARHGIKIAVIENEYGQISIDKLLVNQQTRTNEEIFELNNGCICCKVRGDLIRTLTKLTRRKNKVDAIIIETTGLADPAPVAQTFFTACSADDTLKEHMELDAILTVVDAKHCLQHIHSQNEGDKVNEAVQQVAFADKLLLNKVDLVNDKEKERVVGALKAINFQAQILECSLASAPPEVDRLLGLEAFNLDRVLELDAGFLKEPEDAAEPGHHGHDCERDHPGEACMGAHQHSHKHHHESAVSSVAIEAIGSINPQALNKWLGQLLQERGPDIFRSKGVLCLEGNDVKTVFQGVHNMWQFASSSQPLGQLLNQMVFIGKNLNKTELRAAFESCLMK